MIHLVEVRVCVCVCVHDNLKTVADIYNYNGRLTDMLNGAIF